MLKKIYQNLERLYFKTKYTLGFETHYILPREFYTSNKILELEYKNIFHGLWMFGGLVHELSNKKWIRKVIGKKEILIVKKDDEIFAIENVCPHKNVKMFDEDSGDKPITCRYHAWSFNEDGTNKRIPHYERNYKFGPKQEKMKNMNRYEVAVVGCFIFVKMRKSKLTIEDQFDDAVLKSLKLVSQFININHLATFEEIRNFNWKLNFENLRDSLHPAVLHKNSLATQMDFSAQYNDDIPLYMSIGNMRLQYASSFSLDGSSKSKESKASKASNVSTKNDVKTDLNNLKTLKERSVFQILSSFFKKNKSKYNNKIKLDKKLKRTLPDDSSIRANKGEISNILKSVFDNGYYNWLLFPNFHMACPDGCTYSIEVHTPLTADKVRINHYLICNKQKYNDELFIDELLQHRLQGTRVVYEEDFNACESVQEALGFTDRQQNIGAYEHYNVNIARVYRRILGK